MAYTVLVGGVPIQCETATEAIELARQAGSGADGEVFPPKPTAVDPSLTRTSRWSEERIKQFFRVIKPQQRRLVDALLDTSDGRTDEQLCQLLGLEDGRNLAGVFTGLFKNAKKVGADPTQLYRRQLVTIGDRRVNEYHLSDAFRAAAKQWKP